jgi:hypothetical protein
MFCNFQTFQHLSYAHRKILLTFQSFQVMKGLFCMSQRGVFLCLLNAPQYSIFTFRNITALLALLVTSAASALGSDPPFGFAKVDTGCSETPSDNTFVPDPTGAKDTFQVPRDNGCNEFLENCSAKIPVYITRVVGTGKFPDDQAADGTLKNPSLYVQNGLLQKKAHLSIHAYQTDYPNPGLQGQLRAIIKINGNPIGSFVVPGSGPTASFSTNGIYYERYDTCVEFDVDAQPLKFSQRAPAGQTPTTVNGLAGTNIVEIDAGGQFPPGDFISWVVVGSLSFRAMAPIVMVHGWNSGPWDFGSPSTSSCPANLDPNNTQGELNFVQAFVDAHAPFDCTINVGPQVTTDQGASLVKTNLQPVLDTFGTRHVNLVAHSKGGLYVREFLALNAADDPTQRIGVVSATTLDTPHRGSVLASTVAYYNTFAPTAVLIEFARSIRPPVGFLDKGANDMTPKALAGFNRKYETPPQQFILSDSSGNVSVTTPSYFSTSADADKNHDGKISQDEASPPYGTIFGNFAYQTVARGVPVTTLAVAGLRVLQSVNNDPKAFLNDCLVPIYSAKYPGLTEIQSYYGAQGRNHGTIRSSDVAGRVLQYIVSAESQQP